LLLSIVLLLLLSLSLFALVSIASLLFSYSATQPQVWNKTQWVSAVGLPLILHATLVLSLMNILLYLLRSHHFLSPAILI